MAKKSFYLETAEIVDADMKLVPTYKKTEKGVIKETISPLSLKVEGRIKSEIQKKASAIDFDVFEQKARIAIDIKLKQMNILNIDRNKYNVAVIEEIRNIIRKEVPSVLKINKAEYFNLTDNLTKNTSQALRLIENIKNTRKFALTEKYLSEDYSTIRTRRIQGTFISSSGDDIVEGINDPQNESIILHFDPVLWSYYIAVNRLKILNKGFIHIYTDTIDAFSSHHTFTMYYIVKKYEKIWRNVKFEYRDLQKKFGTHYGVKKQYDNEGVPMLGRDGETLYQVDKNGDYVYEDNYLSSYRFFKRDILQKRIEEINSDKTIFHVEIEDNVVRGRAFNGFLKFAITRKKSVKYKDSPNYQNAGLYMAIRHYFIEYSLSYKPRDISEITEEAHSYNAHLAEGKYKKPIPGIFSLSDLKTKVAENCIAIKEIKAIFSNNFLCLKHYYFDERYLVVINGNRTQSFLSRLGDDALTSLIKLREFLDTQDLVSSIIQPSTLVDFLPFTFSNHTTSIRITIDNLDEKIKMIDLEINNKNHKAFKAFKNIETKKKFKTLFFES
mgnify:CR=1 FL=1|jgi:hypothetical protein